jgi:hypothetical protein
VRTIRAITIVMRMPLAALGFLLLALVLGAWGHEAHDHENALLPHSPSEHTQYSWSLAHERGGHGVTLLGSGLRMALQEPHCHTVGLGYPTMPVVALSKAGGQRDRTYSSKSPVPVILALSEGYPHSVLAPRFKPPGRFTPGRDSEARIFLTTSRLLL